MLSLRLLCRVGQGLGGIPTLDDGEGPASKSTAKVKVMREALQMRARAFFWGGRFEGELKRKADLYRFQIERGLNAFNDLLAQIGDGDRATQAQTV